LEVTKYISRLLYNQECVILPNFGGFVCNYQSATIDHKNNTFFPPRKSILFNKKLTQNDGLLINFIAQAKGIDYLQSKEIIAEFTEKSFKTLKEKNELVFENIGSFYYDSNRIIQFEPDFSTNYLLESYGFQSFHFPALEGNTKIEKRTEVLLKDKKPVRINKKSKIFKPVLIAAPFVLIFGILPLKQNFTNQTKSEMLSLNPISIFSDNEVKQNDSDLKIDIENKTYTQQKSVEIQKEEESKPVELSQHYFIIGGSCRSQSMAQKFVAEIANNSISPFVLEPNNGRFRIALKSFSTKAEAKQELKNYRNSGFPEAWILCQK